MDWLTFFDNAGIWVGSFLTLAVFSFLYRDNPVYKLVEHLYVGIAAGYYLYQAFKGTIYPNLFQHTIEGAQGIAAGTAGAWATQWRWGALVLGMLMLSRLVPKWSWISRWPMALVVGAFAALNLVGFAQANLVDQIHATFIPVWGRMGDTAVMPFFPPTTEGGVGEPSIFNHLVLIVGVISVLTYFLFSSSQRGHFSKLQALGMGFVMVTFGATYGSIVLARISLLIGRVTFLTESNRQDLWYPPLVCGAVIITILVIWRLTMFKPEDEEQ